MTETFGTVHRADGQKLSKRDRRRPPIVAHVDEPASSEVQSGDGTIRVRGWAASTRARPAKARAWIAGALYGEFDATVPRPDVVEALGAEYQLADALCGFEFVIALPESTEERLLVVLEFTDGEYVVRSRRFSVRREVAPVLTRAAYKDVWNAVSTDVDTAKMAVACTTDEERYRSSGERLAGRIVRTTRIQPDDVVLEIGAGVGRLGAMLAPRCKKWIGTDVSENMLRHAGDRLHGLENVELVPISGWDLDPIPSETIDVVYSTVVFMHLDEWERFKYVREGVRVLRPGGRMYADGINLLGEKGWKMFMTHLESFHPLDRPANITKTSTPEEFRTYFERAGFSDVHVETTSLWIYAWGTKN